MRRASREQDTLPWRFAADLGSSFDITIGPSGTVETPKPRPTGTWLHVASTISADGGVRLYLSGKPAGAKTINPINVDPNAHTTIGCKLGGNYFEGVIDEVRIYRRILTDDEIAQLAR